MDPKKLFIDERLSGICSYCGAIADSRDHIPSRVFLDKPYPQNLPIAESCTKCNQGFSVSEEYFACLLECIVHGTTNPNGDFRPKITAILNARPSIKEKIECSKVIDENQNILWTPETARIKEVVLKLARGHMAYELGIQHIDEPDFIEILPIPCMSEAQLESFLSLEDTYLLPEIGSRSFINTLAGRTTAYQQWRIVQADRYQYSIGQSQGDWVKFVLSNYLACHVIWLD